MSKVPSGQQILLIVFVFVLQNCFCSSQHALPPRLGAPTHQISGEHISLEFYAAVEKASNAKDRLQGTLQNFLEILQRNLTTSAVLNTVTNIVDPGRTERQLRKLNDLSAFFQIASENADDFASESQNFFEITKNESYALLLKLRSVPSAQRYLSMEVKLFLTSYFSEMEFFHIMMSEIIDQALEYIVDTLRSTQRTFIAYADIQRDVLRNWNFKPDEWCCNRYMDFLQQWSAEIFKCAAGNELNVAYDVYAMTEVTTKYLLRQLEFRIQRLFNCFLFGSYEIRCRFLHHAEKDFEKLFAKLDELQMYYDIKTKHGRVTIFRQHYRRHANNAPWFDEPITSETDTDAVETQDKCIPYGFPDTQMLSSLKTCFYFPQMG